MEQESLLSFLLPRESLSRIAHKLETIDRLADKQLQSFRLVCSPAHRRVHREINLYLSHRLLSHLTISGQGTHLPSSSVCETQILRFVSESSPIWTLRPKSCYFGGWTVSASGR